MSERGELNEDLLSTAVHILKKTQLAEAPPKIFRRLGRLNQEFDSRKIKEESDNSVLSKVQRPTFCI